MRRLSDFLVKVFMLIGLLHSEAGADSKFLFIFGGFPDVRHLGTGIVSPHGTANPASLQLDAKYDVNISLGFASSDPARQIYVRISDSITSKIGGAFGFKCVSEEFICVKNNSKILEGDLSYGFPVSNILVGFGIGVKAKLDNQFQDKLGPKNTFFGPGVVATTKIKETNLSAGASLFLNFQSMKKIYGGFAVGIISHDIFASVQLFTTEKMILSGGLTIRTLEWFRVSLGYSQGPIAGFGFVSPKLYIWGGYSSRKIGMISFGIAL